MGNNIIDLLQPGAVHHHPGSAIQRGTARARESRRQAEFDRNDLIVANALSKAIVPAASTPVVLR